MMPQLRMRAQVQRNVATAADPYGGPVAPAWQWHANIPCRAWSITPSKQITDDDKSGTKATIRCVLRESADIRPSDRIAAITNRNARVLFAGPLVVASPVRRREGHIEVDLEHVT